MIESKKIGIITAVAVCLALVVTIALIVFSGSSTYKSYTEPQYAEKIFGADIISVEIIADESDWQQMLDNAISEEFIMADVIVNGTKFQNVGVRPKGNSSLRQVAQNNDSDRYSFRLQFDEYVKGQTCFGLQSFVVNNMIGDYTYMKEYVSYELMEEIGVASPYFGYANISVNGEGAGLYLAVEVYNESYEARSFGTTAGMLYNVKSMDMGGNVGAGGGGDMPNMPNGGQRPNLGGGRQNSDLNGKNPNENPPTDSKAAPPATAPNSSNNISERPNGGVGNGMGGRGSNGGSLEYSDDNSSSYSAIFNNVVGKGSESDYQKVIKTLKALSEGKDLEKYFDIDQILRYLAAHTIVVNLDSYSSSMAQNYYVYEKDGQITILPWDYNLTWGGFQSGGASAVINFPIDTPVSGAEMSSRPLIEKLFANSEYLDKYHGYLQELMTNYFADGKWETKIAELNKLISEYVKADKTAFCSYEDYQKAVSSFVDIGLLRAQSVQGQLDGTVPSTTEGQLANADSLISADSLNLSDLGSMMGGGLGGLQGDNFPNGNFNGGMGDMPDIEVMEQVMQIIQEAGGTITDDVREKLTSIGLSEKQLEMILSMQNGMRFGGDNQNLPNGNGFPNTDVASNNAVNLNYLLTVLILVVLLALTILFVAKQNRRY